MNLQPRQYWGYGYNCYGRNCDSNWSRWGRWVLLAALIFGAFLLFFLFSCLSARRRRRRGYNPYYGTGWALGRTPPGHGAATYTGGHQNAQPYYNNSNNPPPAYSPPPNNNYYGNNGGIELQQPQAAYTGSYAPPKDPPPAR